ncbi:MAG: AbrB family transcriptional regulator [Propionibacteriaceae bacterium]|jgi:hypothetical protein|nr:AbrB family transcriptional regulator [Propionibacteriaceae bacterium]
MLTAVRKQGNSLTLTVPKDFGIPVGVKTRPELRDDGIFYRFQEPAEPQDIDTAILRNLVDQGLTGSRLVDEFEATKAKLPAALTRLVTETLANAPMSREAFDAAIQ